jgi:hypothetical protein
MVNAMRHQEKSHINERVMGMDADKKRKSPATKAGLRGVTERNV